MRRLLTTGVTVLFPVSNISNLETGRSKSTATALPADSTAAYSVQAAIRIVPYLPLSYRPLYLYLVSRGEQDSVQQSLNLRDQRGYPFLFFPQLALLDREPLL